MSQDNEKLNSKAKVVCRGFYSKYGSSLPLRKGWQAYPLNDDKSKFRVVDNEGTSKIIDSSDDHELRTDENGDLIYQNQKIYVGKNLIDDLVARPSRGFNYNIMKVGTTTKVVGARKGEAYDHKGMGELTIDEFGNLSDGFKSIKVEKKSMEIQLLIKDEKNEHGVEATMVLNKMIDGKMEKFYTSGSFIQVPGKTSRFVESLLGQAITTAYFNRNGNSVSMSYWEVDDAIGMHNLYKALRDRTGIVQSVNVKPENDQQYMHLKKQLNSIQKKAIKVPIYIQGRGNIRFFEVQQRQATRSPT
ncbi:hypothetical protein AB6D11_03025 [Vibrio splendidus]